MGCQGESAARGEETVMSTHTTVRQVRITNEGTHAYDTQITDAETGERIEYVTRIELVLDARDREPPKAIIHTVLPKVDVTVDAELHKVCPYCGREEEQSE